MPQRILVVGDAMLDKHVLGRSPRLSRELDVPIVTSPETTYKPGGAANTAVALSRLGYPVLFLGVVGCDAEAKLLGGLLRDAGIDASLYAHVAYKTIVKERIVVGSRTVVQIDHELPSPPPDVAGAFHASLTALQPYWDDPKHPIVAVVVVDHDKGLLATVHGPLLACMDRFPQTPLFVDGKRQAVQVMINRKCTFKATLPDLKDRGYLGGEHEDPNLHAAMRLQHVFGDDSVAVVTCGAAGSIAVGEGRYCVEPADPLAVCDPTGAGDAFMAAYVDASLRGMDVSRKLRWANAAGRLAVQRPGTYAPTRAEVDAEYERRHSVYPRVWTMEEVVQSSKAWRTAGESVVVANGCFDLLHPGHLATIEYARLAGKRLILAVNDDASVRALKGPTRPLCSEAFRAGMLARLKIADAVVLFPGDMEAFVRAVLPDILVKGAEYVNKKVVGSEFVAGRGGTVLFAPMFADYSTTNNLARGVD